VVGIDSFLPYYPRGLKEENLQSARQSEHFRFIEGDLNQLPLGELVRDREWIFHQAAQPGVRSSWGRDFSVYLDSNIEATQRLLESCIGSKSLVRFLYASSSSVYGDAATLPISEGSPTQPISPYGLTKLTAERLCSIYAQSFGIPVVSLRYFTVYGPRQRPDMAFHKFGRAMLLEEEIHLYGNGRQTRDFTFVSDVVEANLRAAGTSGLEGEIFNIGGGSRISLLDAIRTMEQVSGRTARLRVEEAARGDVADTFADITRAARAIGYGPHVPLSQGLRAEFDDLERRYTGRGGKGR
jgi:UDP-glucose 4-epimerase